MKGPNKKPIVKLIGTDGNAFYILGKVRKALQKEGADKEYLDFFLKEAQSGDYDHLLITCMEYVEII